MSQPETEVSIIPPEDASTREMSPQERYAHLCAEKDIDGLSWAILEDAMQGRSPVAAALAKDAFKHVSGRRMKDPADGKDIDSDEEAVELLLQKAREMRELSQRKKEGR